MQDEGELQGLGSQILFLLDHVNTDSGEDSKRFSSNRDTELQLTTGHFYHDIFQICFLLKLFPFFFKWALLFRAVLGSQPN